MKFKLMVLLAYILIYYTRAAYSLGIMAEHAKFSAHIKWLMK